jgi:hypothetical protein
VNEGPFEFVARIWLYPGDAGWRFITLPTDVADALDEVAGERRGFGSVPVVVTVGSSTWATSVFPDSKAGSFVLPVKKAVRRNERVDVDDDVAVRLRHDADRD